MRQTDRMLTLYHHPICPHSRFARLVLREYGMPVRQIVERSWERRREFLILNPAATLPVLVTEDDVPVPSALIIMEYLDEVYGRDFGENRLLPQDAAGRIEVRRLLNWFAYKFFEEVSGPLTDEHYKQYMPIELGAGTRDSAAIRAALENVSYHLTYIGVLLAERDWLAGACLTYADFAAAAHLSIVPHFHPLQWPEDGVAKRWHERIQSRPAFQSMLAEGWKSTVR
jgi:glutathione S-transferase